MKRYRIPLTILHYRIGVEEAPLRLEELEIDDYVYADTIAEAKAAAFEAVSKRVYKVLAVHEPTSIEGTGLDCDPFA